MKPPRKAPLPSIMFFLIIFGIAWTGFLLYGFIDKQNHLIELRLAIPKEREALRVLQEEVETLQYSVESFESPLQLMDLLRKPEFAHLKFVSTDNVIEIPMSQELWHAKE